MTPQTKSRERSATLPGPNTYDPSDILHPISQSASPLPAASLVPSIDVEGLRLLAIGAQSDVSLVSARFRTGSLTEDEAAAQSHNPITLIVLVGSELDRRLHQVPA